MPFWRFTLFTVAGCIPWVLMLTAIGNAAGDNWRHWKHYFSYLDYVALAAILIGIVYLVVRRRGRSAETEAV
jgi:membrane protein DedA with SNARE-associated domain